MNNKKFLIKNLSELEKFDKEKLLKNNRKNYKKNLLGE